MKKINSIEHDGKISDVAMIFALFIPVAIHLAMLVCKIEVLAICAKISLRIGILIALSFCVFLGIEFHQDKEQNLDAAFVLVEHGIKFTCLPEVAIIR